MQLLLSLLTAVLGLAGAIPFADMKAPSAVCTALAKGSDYGSCKLDWATYNACNCYHFNEDRERVCGTYLQAAVRCAALHRMQL
jgi:hypothetical protein